jgi:hypothetical protein
MRVIFTAGLVAVSILIAVPEAQACDADGWVLGVTYTTVPADQGLDIGADNSKLVPGVGGFITVNVAKALALEAEVDGYFPQQELGLIGATPKRKLLAVAGLRLGGRYGAISAAVKVRPGMLWSRYDLVTVPAASRSDDDFVIDVGGVLEYRLSQRWLLRLDAGDLFIPSDDRASHPFDEHNLRLAVGIGLYL